MINFRYHVVSLTAVFLALAIGLVVGTAALNGPVADSLKEQVTALRKDNSSCATRSTSLQDEVNREEEFATEAAPIAARRQADRPQGAGRRAARRGRDHVDGVARDADHRPARRSPAGSTVQDKFFDPDERRRAARPGRTRRRSRPIPADGLPSNSDGVETSSALLASGAAATGTRPVAAPPTCTAVLDRVQQGRAT